MLGCRIEAEVEAAPRGRAGSSRADPTWGRADASGPGQQRVLRRRDPRGRGGAQETRHDTWDDKEQLGTGASQGVASHSYTHPDHMLWPCPPVPVTRGAMCCCVPASCLCVCLKMCMRLASLFFGHAVQMGCCICAAHCPTSVIFLIACLASGCSNGNGAQGWIAN